MNATQPLTEAQRNRRLRYMFRNAVIVTYTPTDQKVRAEARRQAASDLALDLRSALDVALQRVPRANEDPKLNARLYAQQVMAQRAYRRETLRLLRLLIVAMNELRGVWGKDLAPESVGFGWAKPQGVMVSDRVRPRMVDKKD